MAIYKKDKAGKLVLQRQSVQFNCQGESLTEQHHADACDINKIVERFDRTGTFSNYNAAEAKFGDFSSGEDFAGIQNRVASAEQNFMELPAHVRKYFNNDVSELIDFLQDESNMDEAVRLGLFESNAEFVDEKAPQARPEGTEGGDKDPEKGRPAKSKNKSDPEGVSKEA